MNKLEQCPFFKSHHCAGEEYCGGCEDLHEVFNKVKELEEDLKACQKTIDAHLDHVIELKRKEVRYKYRLRDVKGI